ncbi:carbon-nitrogen hydrolase family protein [Georgenia yuyongxinii]|uniref:Carbon-nitrogen hydrolase family protein n=1 Tax=Georgenia yuyongxinii TaxID=2589797 RepID=A0A552WRW3_9MICO|nr:carbon-nitrogen hydrolase family protein [Georgenia yuyongxinii]TRW45329.1 carbon-nitrogen hydrolase family protein [Georgenia yuyongxinii]
MHVAVAQLAASTDRSVNLDAATALVRRAASAGAQLVVLPEYTSSWEPRPSAESLATAAVTLDGPFVGALARAAHEHRVTVLAGLVERNPAGKSYNTVVALNSGGELVGAYRKVHLYDAFGDRESDRLAAHPPEALVLDTGGLRVGVMTCYDLRFPEMARFLVDAGADVLAVPAAWVAGPGKVDHWLTLARARAIENTVYVVACGQTGKYRSGHSVIVDPAGEVLAAMGEEQGVAVAEISPGRIQEVRELNPSLANRRFEVSPR